jgi:hypothetical protein
MNFFRANGTIVYTYVCITLRLDLSLSRELSWRFVVADVTGPIIGSDFLSFYSLLVYIRIRRLIDITNHNVNGASVGMYGGQVKVLVRSSRYYALLKDSPDIVRIIRVIQVLYDLLNNLCGMKIPLNIS